MSRSLCKSEDTVGSAGGGGTAVVGRHALIDKEDFPCVGSDAILGSGGGSPEDIG